jgi:hypothetical protein
LAAIVGVMAQPLPAAKPSVDLAKDGPRVSKIRREPLPPAVKEIEVRDRDERDRSDVLIGVLVFALAIFSLIVAFGVYSGWSPREYKIEVNYAE